MLAYVGYYPGYYGYGYDPTLIFALIGLALSVLASFLVNSRFSKYDY